MELLKATEDCAFSQRPSDLCREWPWMGTRALWHLLRGWTPPGILTAAGPWAHLAGKDRHWYWVHSSLSESSSFGTSSLLAAGKESCYCPRHTWAGLWLGKSQTRSGGEEHRKRTLCCSGKQGAGYPDWRKGCNQVTQGADPGSTTSSVCGSELWLNLVPLFPQIGVKKSTELYGLFGKLRIL